MPKENNLSRSGTKLHCQLYRSRFDINKDRRIQSKKNKISKHAHAQKWVPVLHWYAHAQKWCSAARIPCLAQFKTINSFRDLKNIYILAKLALIIVPRQQNRRYFISYIISPRRSGKRFLNKLGWRYNESEATFNSDNWLVQIILRWETGTQVFQIH